MTRDLKEAVNKFGAFIASMTEVLQNKIDMQSDIIYGTEYSGSDNLQKYNYLALPIRNLEGAGLDKDAIDKIYSLMAFFVDNVLGVGNIYLTQRENKLVIEIAWR